MSKNIQGVAKLVPRFRNSGNPLVSVPQQVSANIYGKTVPNSPEPVESCRKMTKKLVKWTNWQKIVRFLEKMAVGESVCSGKEKD